MNNLYWLGFWISTALTIEMAAVCFLGVTSRYGLDKAFNYISAAGTLMGGLAGVGAVSVAAYGLSTWRKQLYHGKYLSVIWDVKVALGKVEADWVKLSVNSLSLDPKNAAEVYEFLQNSDFKKSLDMFKSSCQILDRLVEKRGWLWTNRAGELELHTANLLLHSTWLKKLVRPTEHLSHMEASVPLIMARDDYVANLNQKLDSLEKQWQ